MKNFLFSAKSTTKDNGETQIIKILGGIISIKKRINDYKIKIFGISVYRKIQEQKTIIYICGIPAYIKDREKDFFRNLQQEITYASHSIYGNNETADHIFIIRHNIGESIVYLSQLTCWAKALQAKRPLLLIWRKKDWPLYKLFINPKELPIHEITLSRYDINNFLRREQISIKNTTMHIPSFDIFNQMAKTKKENPRLDINFVTWILHSMSFRQIQNLRPPRPSQNDKEAINLFLKEKNIPTKYILICPEATSLMELPKSFWEKITEHFSHQGYFILINTYYDKYRFTNGQCCSPTIGQLYVLAEKAYFTFSLASGLGALLSIASKNITLIYTKFKNDPRNLTPEEIKNLYSVHKLPWNNSKNTTEITYKGNLDLLFQELTNQD